MDGDEDEFDFMSLLAENVDPGQSSVLAVAPGDGVVANPSQLPVVEKTTNSGVSKILSLPSMVGRVGSGRHGNGSQPNLLTCHMRHCKFLRKLMHFSKTSVTSCTTHTL